MRILALETSCDETCAAIVEDGWKVHANVIASSIDLHKKTGGVVPEVAARAHIEAIIPVIEEALEEMAPGKSREEQIAMIDKIAVANEPGLLPSLLIGTETAKWLGYLWKKEVISVNHVRGHVYANWLDSPPTENTGANLKTPPGEITDQNLEENTVKFPVLCLSISGGHNELILMKDHGDFEIIGETQDDAAGEAFDKVARLLGLGYPGGPVIEEYASKFTGELGEDPNSNPANRAEDQSLKFPRSWLNSNNSDKWDGTSYNFSFSGIKSEVAREVQRRGELSEDDRVEIAYAFQEAVFDVLVTKFIGAAEKFGAAEIHIAGGVSANKRFRELIKEKSDLPFRYPAKMVFCTDNAAMIGAAGYFQKHK